MVTLCMMLGNFSCFCCGLLIFFKQLLIIPLQTVWTQIRTSVLIWIQTVCKGYQQMTKVATSKERVKSHIEFLHWLQCLYLLSVPGKLRTSSPGLNRLTPLPVSLTVPLKSLPRVSGNTAPDGAVPNPCLKAPISFLP